MRPPPTLQIAIFLLSAAALAYEILLMRLLSIVHWQHFAAMIISLALLGYGASGTFLTLTRRFLRQRFRLVFASGAVLFFVTAYVAILVSQRLPFNPLELPWNWRQIIILGSLYLLFSVPFFCAATSIGLAFTEAEGRIAKLYRADLAGAGTGAIGVLLLLSAVSLRSWLPLRISEFKPLAQSLNVPGARLVEERPSALGLVSVVQSSRVPFRFAPGLSLNYFGELPEQIGIFTDAAGLTVINRYDPERLNYLDYTSAALPYFIRRPEKVLVLNAGGGGEVLSALRHGVPRVEALELNGEIAGLVQRRYAEFSGNVYTRPQVRVHRRQMREFLAGSETAFDLIVDSSAAGAGMPVLAENYIYTVEGMGQMIPRLSDQGAVAITRTVNLPPRDTLKLVATANAALQRSGVQTPANHLAMIRGWNSVTLLVSRPPLSPADIAQIRRFCEERSFDLGFYPGMRRDEANRYNTLDEPFFYDGVLALTSERREQFLHDYKFNIVPATDNRPYFAHSFRWRTFPEIMRLRLRGGAPLLEIGYLVLVAAFAQAILAGLVLILLPLAVVRKRPGSARVIVCFAALGLAFLFVEIFFIQKLTLLLAHPLLAVSITLAGFLVFAGLGSGWSSRVRSIFLPVTAIVALLTLAAVVLPLLIQLPNIWKVVLSLVLIAPLAFFMGMPFPMALAAIGERNPDWVPWAWSINGCASVISPLAATLLGIHLGFSLVVLSAALLYAIAATVRT